MSTGDATEPQPTGTRCRVIDLPRILDRRGNLTFVEGRRHIPFAIARTYWLHDVPGGQMRGGHAYRELEEFVISLSGSFDVVVDEGSGPRHIALNRSYLGLYIPRLVWRHIENFSTNAVCLILASRPYDPEDYMRDYPEFVRAATEPR